MLLNALISSSQGRLMCSVCQFPWHQNLPGSHLEPPVRAQPGHKVPKAPSLLWCSVVSDPPLPFISAPASSAVIPVLRKALWMPLQTRLLSADGPPESGLPQQILAQLVPFARAKDLRALMDRLPSLLQTPASHTRYESSALSDGPSCPSCPFPVVLKKP